MKAGDDPNAFWQSVLARFPEKTALISVDGQQVTFSQLDRAIANIADLLIDYGAGPGAKIACLVPNFAVTVAFWFATWRIGAHVMTAPDPQQFVEFGLTPDIVIVTIGETTPVGTPVFLHANSLVDEPGVQTEAPARKTFFHTANTPRDRRVMAVESKQLVRDARLYSDLLGEPQGGVYMTTGLSSLRAMRDVFRAFDAGVHIVGGDIAPEHVWPVIRKTKIRELMLSPLSLREVLKHAGDEDKDHAINRVFIGAGTAQPHLLARAHAFFGDVIELGAGTNETSVYAWKKFDPLTHSPGEIGQTCCGIIGEIRDSEGNAVAHGQEGRLALWVPLTSALRGILMLSPPMIQKAGSFPDFWQKCHLMGRLRNLAAQMIALIWAAPECFPVRLRQSLNGSTA